MPRLVSIWEYRWYTPDAAPAAGAKCKLVELAKEKEVRERAIAVARQTKNWSEGDRRTSFEKYFQEFGPSGERTVCRSIDVLEGQT